MKIKIFLILFFIMGNFKDEINLKVFFIAFESLFDKKNITIFMKKWILQF